MDRKPKLLIVEDEPAILKGLVDVFTFHGFEVDGEENGEKGLQKALQNPYHLVLLDIMLPGKNGFEICNEIRAKDREQPIIMLTAKTAEEDILKGFTLGADDYITKPFSLQELLARVHAVLRRSPRFRANRTSFYLGDLQIDPQTLLGHRENHEILFTRREIEILLYLKSQKPRAVSRNELLKEVWGYSNPDAMETRTIDIHMAKLRKKIEKKPLEPKHVITVRGEGYRLSEEG